MQLYTHTHTGNTIRQKENSKNKISTVRKNIKWIIVVLVVLILYSGITTYAAYKYYAKDVGYTKSDGTSTNVESILNELYKNNTLELSNEIYESYINSASTINNTPVSLNLNKGQYLLIVEYKRCWVHNIAQNAYTKIEKSQIPELTSKFDADVEKICGNYSETSSQTTFNGVYSKMLGYLYLYKLNIKKDEDTITYYTQLDSNTGAPEECTIKAIKVNN